VARRRRNAEPETFSHRSAGLMHLPGWTEMWKL
jgi:hypothetical protein